MPLRRISEDGHTWVRTGRICSRPEHYPPSMKVYEPGTYEWTCPHSGAKQTFVVPERPKL